MKSDSDEDEDEPDQDGESGSEDSGFGIENKKKKTKKSAVLKRQTRKSAPPPGFESAGAAPVAAPAPVESSLASSKNSGNAKSSQNPAKLISQASQLKQSLKQASPILLWQQPQKAKEIDNKIRRAWEKTSQLELLVDSEEASSLHAELTDLTKSLSSWVELVTHGHKGFAQCHGALGRECAFSHQCSCEPKCGVCQSCDSGSWTSSHRGTVLGKRK